MHTVGTIVSWALLVAPAPVASQRFTVDDVELRDSGSALEVVSYDFQGEVTAELVIWTDLDAHARLDVAFADGHWMFVEVNGDLVALASSDTPKMIRRIGQVWRVLSEFGVADHWGMCTLHAAEMAEFCEGDIISCMAAALHFSC